MKYSVHAYLCAALLCCFAAPEVKAAPWFPFGPDGGDARAFASDPKDHTHIYLGTANGWLYESRDEGQKWVRLPRLDKRDDLVLDNILVDATDSKHIIVGARGLGQHTDGGIFISNDGGATWTPSADMVGQSVLALSGSPSDPKIMIAGTLAGVYRSTDTGTHWSLISPAGDKQLHEVESIAIDPKDPQTIYAGTWHLPWKTVDGGAKWNPMAEGIAVDSDVFSIIVDPTHPNIVYASACSGIYKSENSGGKFGRALGIPDTAHRTRVLMQDPNHLDTVFAGTTSGLYRTKDAGKVWTRTTGPEVIINDVYVDPTDSQKVFLATDRGGVLASVDGGTTFIAANGGFSARQVSAMITDTQHPATVYAGVVNDKTLGGVFMSQTAGVSWTQMSAGLDGRDVFSLGQASDGTVLAGTGHGIYRLAGSEWKRAVGDLTVEKPAVAVTAKARGKASVKATPVAVRARRSGAVKEFDGVVFSFAASGNSLFAATSNGMLRSMTGGTTWKPADAIPSGEWRFLGGTKSNVIAANLSSAVLSTDGGASWQSLKLPPEITQVSAAAVDAAGEAWIAGRQGVYFSADKGATWTTLPSLYVRNVNSIFFDEAGSRMLITSNGPATVAFAVQLPTMAVSYWDTGWTLRLVRPEGDHLIAATLFDGVVVQGKMAASVEAAGQ